MLEIRKVYLVLIIIILFNTCINSQSLRLGITADFLVGNKYLNYEFGPALVLDYSFRNIPVSIQGKARFYLSELSEENNFSAGYTYTLSSVGVSINYYPIDWDIEPYIGLGIAYNFNDLQQSGNAHFLSEGTIRGPGNLENNFSTEITGGINFSANTPINFIVEVTQTFNKPSYNLGISDKDYNQTIQKTNFNFNSIFLKLGLLFRI